VEPCDEKRGAELFRATVEFLAACGYDQYEVSNFAFSDPAGGITNRSRHNRKYWTFAPYLGFGPGAHSYLEPQRYWNHRNLQIYLTDIRSGNRPTAGSETLTRPQMMMEAILLGLRQSDGIELAAFKKKFGLDFKQHFAGQIQELLEEGKARVGEGRLALTCEGMLLLDSICAQFVEALED
jgi:oxygen-independent coproporphyrinogen-3 oxidase